MPGTLKQATNINYRIFHILKGKRFLCRKVKHSQRKKGARVCQNDKARSVGGKTGYQSSLQYCVPSVPIWFNLGILVIGNILTKTPQERKES